MSRCVAGRLCLRHHADRRRGLGAERGARRAGARPRVRTTYYALPAHHTLLITHYSPSTTYYSSLPTEYLLLPTPHSPLTTCHSPTREGIVVNPVGSIHQQGCRPGVTDREGAEGLCTPAVGFVGPLHSNPHPHPHPTPTPTPTPNPNQVRARLWARLLRLRQLLAARLLPVRGTRQYVAVGST